MRYRHRRGRAVRRAGRGTTALRDERSRPAAWCEALRPFSDIDDDPDSVFSANGRSTSSSAVQSAMVRRLRAPAVRRRSAEKSACPRRFIPSRFAFVCITTTSRSASSGDSSRVVMRSASPSTMSPSRRRVPRLGPGGTAVYSSYSVPPRTCHSRRVIGVSRRLIASSSCEYPRMLPNKPYKKKRS